MTSDRPVADAERPSCQQPTWDGPFKMRCNRYLVDGQCGLHGPQSVAAPVADAVDVEADNKALKMVETVAAHLKYAVDTGVPLNLVAQEVLMSVLDRAWPVLRAAVTERDQLRADLSWAKHYESRYRTDRDAAEGRVRQLEAENAELRGKLANAGHALNITQGHEIRADIAEARAVAAEAQVARVRELHTEIPTGSENAHFCTGCDHMWPCPTVTALDGP